MKIIVIGMDNTGKTTLCEKLSKELNYEHVKSPGPHLSKEEMVDWMNEQLSKDNIIIERFPFFEEMVYGKVLRGKSKFTFRDMTLRDCLIINCKPSKFIIGNKEEMDGVVDHQDQLRKRWRQIIRKIKKLYTCFNYRYDYQKDPQAEEVLNVISQLS